MTYLFITRVEKNHNQSILVVRSDLDVMPDASAWVKSL